MHTLYMVCCVLRLGVSVHQFIVHDDYTLSHLCSYVCLEAKYSKYPMSGLVTTKKGVAFP